MLFFMAGELHNQLKNQCVVNQFKGVVHES